VFKTKLIKDRSNSVRSGFAYRYAATWWIKKHFWKSEEMHMFWLGDWPSNLPFSWGSTTPSWHTLNVSMDISQL